MGAQIHYGGGKARDHTNQADAIRCAPKAGGIEGGSHISWIFPSSGYSISKVPRESVSSALVPCPTVEWSVMVWPSMSMACLHRKSPSPVER